MKQKPMNIIATIFRVVMAACVVLAISGCNFTKSGPTQDEIREQLEILLGSAKKGVSITKFTLSGYEPGAKEDQAGKQYSFQAEIAVNSMLYLPMEKTAEKLNNNASILAIEEGGIFIPGGRFSVHMPVVKKGGTFTTQGNVVLNYTKQWSTIFTFNNDSAEKIQHLDNSQSINNFNNIKYLHGSLDAILGIIKAAMKTCDTASDKMLLQGLYNDLVAQEIDAETYFKSPDLINDKYMRTL